MTEPATTIEQWYPRLEEAPDDLELRMVFADWLVQRGDPLGELIQLECRALREPTHADARRWLRQATALRERHAADWWGAAASYAVVRGGMIEGVVQSLCSVELLDQLLPVAPALTALDLSGQRATSSDEYERIAAHPLWRRVRSLTLYGQRLGGPIGAIDADNLPRLERLRASSLGASDAQRLLGTLELVAPKLVHLELPQLDAHPASFLQLARWRRALRTLDLGGNELGGDGATALAAGRLLDGVRELRLSKTRLGTEGLVALAASPHLAQLERLDLGDASLGGEAVDGALARLAAAAPRLLSLELQGARLRGAHAYLAAAWPSLRELSLQGCKIGDDGLRQLLDSPLAARLETLNLRANELSNRSAEALASAQLPSLRLLNLESNPLTATGLQRLRSAPSLADAVVTAGRPGGPNPNAERTRPRGVWLASCAYSAATVIRRPRDRLSGRARPSGDSS